MTKSTWSAFGVCAWIEVKKYLLLALAARSEGSDPCAGKEVFEVEWLMPVTYVSLVHALVVFDRDES